MSADRGNRRWIVAGLILVLALLVAGGTGAALLVLRYRAAADYPGAILVADHSLYEALPFPTVRRTTSYRTTDAFPTVYNWYSNGFHLGPEVRAQSGCILMAQATTSLRLFQQHMTVTLCDTPKGRLIFVTRWMTLRYRR